MITKKYRKKPVIIEAYQTDKEVIIHTLEGDMKASVGDYIITGVNGEQYPCKPDIFEKTYEPVDDSESIYSSAVSAIENIVEKKITQAFESFTYGFQSGLEQQMSEMDDE
ncbi:MAG: hypothetical protein ACI3T9_06840 [Romboutsia timonensis]